MSSYRMKYKIGATQYHIPVVDDMAGFGSGIPLGTILPYSANTLNPPEGFLFCDGSAISRAMYPDLFALIGTLYGEGDGSTTFNLPDLTDKFIEGNATAGTAKAAGLPNIEGYFSLTTGAVNGRLYTLHPYTLDGAFYKSDVPSNAVSNDSVSSSTTGSAGPAFDASRSNAIYGNSDTVQPPALTMRHIIKAFSATSSNSELIDITQYASALNGKPSKSLNDLNSTGEDHFLERDFCFVYPNNGTESNPANVTNGSEYIVSNPFPGYYVCCIPEVLYNNSEWVELNWVSTTGSGWCGYGISVVQADNEDIHVITGSISIYTNSQPNTYLSGAVRNGSTDYKTIPCRIKVWKIGKIPS